jgi:hypothetical protein
MKSAAKLSTVDQRKKREEKEEKQTFYFFIFLVPWISGGGAGQSAQVTADLCFPKAGGSTPLPCSENGGK